MTAEGAPSAPHDDTASAYSVRLKFGVRHDAQTRAFQAPFAFEHELVCCSVRVALLYQPSTQRRVTEKMAPFAVTLDRRVLWTGSPGLHNTNRKQIDTR